jgi:hypothetical protein
MLGLSNKQDTQQRPRRERGKRMKIAGREAMKMVLVGYEEGVGGGDRSFAVRA